MFKRTLFFLLLISITACGGDGGEATINVSGCWEFYTLDSSDPSSTEYGPNCMELTQSDGTITGKSFLACDYTERGSLSGTIDGVNITLSQGTLEFTGEVSYNTMSGTYIFVSNDYVSDGTWRAERIYYIYGVKCM